MTVGNRKNPFVSAPCCFRHHRCARLFRVTKGEHCPKTTAYFAGCFEVADLWNQPLFISRQSPELGALAFLLGSVAHLPASAGSSARAPCRSVTNPEPSHECEIVKVLLTLSKLIMSCSEAISHCCGCAGYRNRGGCTNTRWRKDGLSEAEAVEGRGPAQCASAISI